MNGKTILIVGARSVIARALAKHFSDTGASLILTSSGDTIDSPIAGRVETLDLSKRDSIEAFLERMKGVRLDGVVVAAGVVAFGGLESTPMSVSNRLMQINASGPIELVTGLVENLKLGEEPFVVTLSGKIAEIPTAGMAAYSASKAALYAFSVAAARELRRSGIRWIDARPGHTETGLAGRSIHGDAPAFPVGLNPDDVADRIMLAIESGEKDLPSSSFEVK